MSCHTWHLSPSVGSFYFIFCFSPGGGRAQQKSKGNVFESFIVFTRIGDKERDEEQNQEEGEEQDKELKEQNNEDEEQDEEQNKERTRRRRTRNRTRNRTRRRGHQPETRFNAFPSTYERHKGLQFHLHRRSLVGVTPFWQFCLSISL